MSRKRLVTLVIVMLVSFSMFISNLTGLVKTVRAENMDGMQDQFSDENPEDYEGMPQGDGYVEDSSQGENTGQNESFSGEEEFLRRIEEAEAEAKRQKEEEERLARLAEEERLAKEAEEQARLAKEAELAKQAEEAKRIAEEEQRKRDEEEAVRQAEAARMQKALEEEAKKAEEEAQKKEQEAAAAEAKRLAEEELKKAMEEAEKAKKAAEEAKEAEGEYSYALRTMVDGGAISNVVMDTNVGEGDSLIFSVVNTGMRDVDLVYGISNATADVFSLSIVEGSTVLTTTGMSKFQIALRSSAPVGTYKATIYLKDKQDDTNKYAHYINITGIVNASAKVSKVTVFPNNIKLAQGSECDFYAEVQSSGGEVSQDVNYSVTGARSEGTYITEYGMLVIDRQETANSLTVVATSVYDKNYSGTANVIIQKNSFNVNAVADPQKGGIVTGAGAVEQGGSVTLTAVPNKNYVFAGWVRDGVVVSTAVNYKVTDVNYNMNITAKFKQNYVTITAMPENDQAGSVVGGGNFIYGGKTILSAVANKGYVFVGWKEGDVIISNSPSLEIANLTYNRKIIAIFSRTNYTVTLSCSPFQGGSVSGGGTFKVGESAVISAKPATGFLFQGWTVNNQIVSRELTYKIDKVVNDYSLTAVFIPEGVVVHKMTAGVATTGGTISPSGVVSVARGSSITYTITPKSGFAILAVAVDNVQVGPVPTYTFSDIKSDHAIAAAFVQTDAGVSKAQAAAAAKKAESAGEGKSSNNDKTSQVISESEAIQIRKVQKIYENDKTVSENYVVDLDAATSGTAGSEYVAEMDLTGIDIPTDEELGIVEENTDSSEVLRRLDMNMDEVRQMVNGGYRESVIDAAFYGGSLDVYVNNEYAPPAPIADYHMLSREELENLYDEDIYPSVPNSYDVVEDIMSTGEVLELAEGAYGNVTISLTNTDKTIDEASKKKINTAIGQKPLTYFDLTVVKMISGASTNITELGVPMQVIVEIPQEIYKSGKTYSILRLHDGELSVLPDLDDDPKTITFKTDRFSSYAISEQKATPKEMVINFAIGALITLVIALTCFIIIMYHHIYVMRNRRKNRRPTNN
ncbi:MAG: InlB B-repeat-containing protein [Lachnospiraceae bacterium]|nr:InlB B-repeat-containing protein [Lachnospiraceae bacterium]